ncbi:MAG TPA: zinc dependent phospholipase C family protein [Anaerolineales bacterium]|nr:zinc dependent phospholipase C family protein [Anaerolineales bacterium]
MPTPFYHLRLAQELINHPNLPETIRGFLQAVRCEFLFGSTAPDVQVISGQPRQETHFFNLPIQAGDPPAWEVLLTEYPHLRSTEKLPAARVAFIAGYLCHLQADWRWITDIFAPVFGPGCPWETFQRRLYYHNVLRAYLDQEVLPDLGAGMDGCLSQVEPDRWLPFIKDDHLVEWRDFLVPQLRSGAATHTVEVFSARQGRSVPEYQALLGSQERMQREIFARLPLERIQSYWLAVLDDNYHMVIQYLAFALHQSDMVL